MNETITVECPHHKGRKADVVMDKPKKATLHPCGCYLQIEETKSSYKVTMLPDNPPGDTVF